MYAELHSTYGLAAFGICRINGMGIAERIDIVMKRKGFTPSEVARRLGNQPGRMAVKSWQIGETLPKADDLIRLAEAIEVDPVWLLTGQGSEFSEAELRAIEIVRALGLSKNEVIQRLYNEDDRHKASGYAQPIARIDMTEQAKRELKGPQSKRRVASTKGPIRSTDQAGSDDSADRSQSAKDAHR